MAGRNQEPDAPALFDLPMEPDEKSGPRPAPKPAPDSAAEPPDALSLFPEWEGEADDGEPETAPAAERQPPPVVPPVAVEAAPPAPAPRPADEPPSLGARLRAGILDLGVLSALLIVILVGSRLLDVTVGPAAWPGVATFLLAFSFLYHVVPLAFWGHTPGMASVGLVARSAGGRPLTFGQTWLRWLGALLTLALAGLPLLLALTGRSLTDRISGSQTLYRE